VSSRSRVDDESLRVSDVCQVTGKDEVVNDRRSCGDVSLDSEAQHSSESCSRSDESLGDLVRGVRPERKREAQLVSRKAKERETHGSPG